MGSFRGKQIQSNLNHQVLKMYLGNAVILSDYTNILGDADGEREGRMGGRQGGGKGGRKRGRGPSEAG